MLIVYREIAIIVLIVAVIILFVVLQKMKKDSPELYTPDKIIKLPEPVYDSNTSVEKALLNRRSVRN